MKRVFVMLLLNSMICISLHCQNLMQQIDSAYQSLDSVSYLENMIQSYRNYEENLIKEWEDLYSEYPPIKITMDSIYRYHQSLKKKWYNKFTSEIYHAKPVYVLKLLETKDSLNSGKVILEVDRSKLNFNLFYFGKNFKGDLYVYVDSGKYSAHDHLYINFNQELGRSAPKAFKKIMSRKPKYLLRFSQFEPMNAIPYVLNDKIYVYRIVQKEEYELDEYLKNFQ